VTPREEIEKRLHEYVTEVIRLRFEATLPPASAGTDQVLDGLIATRQRLDRVEELMIRALRIRTRAKRGSVLAAAQAEDLWDQAVRAIATAPVVRGPEFQGPRERYSAANLETVEARREARLTEELHTIAEETYEAIRAMHRGLDGLRQDHVTMLRAVQFIAHLET